MNIVAPVLMGHQSTCRSNVAEDKADCGVGKDEEDDQHLGKAAKPSAVARPKANPTGQTGAVR
jgi:hypothetical protein